MHLARQLLKHFPLLLNDIYLSEEYYGENVLHMAAVAEDPSIVKWLLDIGADFHRRCYGNFFTCDDQKGSRSDNKNYEPVDLVLQTNYHGFVSWGEYPFAFAAGHCGPAIQARPPGLTTARRQPTDRCPAPSESIAIRPWLSRARRGRGRWC